MRTSTEFSSAACCERKGHVMTVRGGFFNGCLQRPRPTGLPLHQPFWDSLLCQKPLSGKALACLGNGLLTSCKLCWRHMVRIYHQKDYEIWKQRHTLSPGMSTIERRPIVRDLLGTEVSKAVERVSGLCQVPWGLLTIGFAKFSHPSGRLDFWNSSQNTWFISE